MRKTTNWNFAAIVEYGAQELIDRGTTTDYTKARFTVLSGMLQVIKNEFESKIPGVFNENAFAIATFKENTSIVLCYDGHVFEVNQDITAKTEEDASFIFSLVPLDDERIQAYKEKCARLKAKADQLTKQMLENRETFNQHAGRKDLPN